MKIAFFSDCYLDLTGGIVSSINAQKAALEKNGHTVYIFSTSYPKSIEERQKLAEKSIFLVPSCRWCFRGFTPVSRHPKLIEKWLLREHPEIQNFDIYYVHYESGCSIAGLRLAKKLNIPSIQVMHGREDIGEANIIPFGFRTLVAFFLNWFHSWYIPHPVKIHKDNYLANTIAKAKMWTVMVNHANYADLVLTPSAHFRQKLIHYGVKKEIKVFPNGFSDALSPAKPTIKTLKPDEELRIIWHSRVSGEKRIMPFLQALKDIDGKYHLDIYGSGADLLRAKLYAKEHHLNAKFHGDVKFTKLAADIDKAHLDVLTSYNGETFGMALIEAEAFATPVFFCDPNMQEIVPPNSFIMSTNETPAAMAKAINKLLQDPAKIHQMSQIMFKHRKEILISNRIKILEKIFNDIIKT